MTRLVLIALVAACTTTTEPAPSTLIPMVLVQADEAQMLVAVSFEDEKHVADVDVTFRGHTTHLASAGEHSSASNGMIELDHPLQADEPIVLTVGGIAMTLDPPPPFDGLVVPQFISRGGSATISWTTPSPETVGAFTTSSACVRGGGMTGPNATSMTFTSSDWIAVGSLPDNATCTTGLELYRTRMATVDPQFQGGSIEMDQTADVVFASTL